jgi:putative peptidoglycan lipid II flippase
MIRRLFSGQINSITIAALLVALSSLLSRFLGIFRDRILAGEFGAGDTLDIYYAAFRVPDIIFNLLVLGALSAGFIPILTALIRDHDATDKRQKLKERNAKAWELVNDIMNLMIVTLVALSFIGIIFAPQIVRLMVPGFSPEKQALTASLTQIMFLSPIFLGISSILGGILQTFKRFFVYSLSPIFYNIGIIVGALYLVPIYGVFGLAWGVVLGAFFHMLVQLPLIFRLGYSYRIRLNIRNENLRKIIYMMLPRTLSLATAQINLLVITIMASHLSGGSLAVFNFANNLQSFPIGIFGISFAVAAFPVLSNVAFDKKKLVRNVSQVFRQILFFIVPATVLLMSLRAQIVRVVLGTGSFGWQDTLATIDTLGFFALSLFAQATIPLLTRVFYARHDTKTPLYIGLFSVLSNVLLSLWLPKLVIMKQMLDVNGELITVATSLGVSGLALAFSIASILNFVLLWIALRYELGDLDEQRVFWSALKFSVAALAAGIAVQGMKLLILPYIDMYKLLGVLAQGFSAGISGILVYVAFCSLMRSEELFDFWHSIKRRLPWRKIETGDQGEARGI